MKKFLIIVLSLLFTSIAYADIEGTYEVTFFSAGVENCKGKFCFFAEGRYSTNNCELAMSKYGVPKCKQSSDADIKYSRVVVTKNADDTITIVTKMYMTSNVIEKFSKADAYQYAIYNPATKSGDTYSGVGIKDARLNVDVEPNAPSSLVNYPTANFKVTNVDNNTIRIDLDLKDKKDDGMTFDAPTIIIATKNNDKPEKLENTIPNY